MNKNILISAAVVGAALSATASAQGYVGGSIGRSYLSPSESNWTAACCTTRFDKNDVSWKLLGGYNFNANFGVEAAYVDLGRYQANITGASTGTAKVKVSSWDLFLTGRMPVGTDFGLTGKIGAAYNRSSMSFAGTGAFLASDSGSNNRTSVAWGLGLTYAVAKNVTLRAEYENFGKAGESNGGFTVPGKTSDSSPTLWSLGVQVGF
jgi:OOP family OmpA-OmpF porin